VSLRRLPASGVRNHLKLIAIVVKTSAAEQTKAKTKLDQNPLESLSVPANKLRRIIKTIENWI
jgi:hypothetical protein